MIYCPSSKDYKRLKLLLLALPEKLLELLNSRGLSIWVLKGDLESNRFLYRELGRELVKYEPDWRYPHEAPHFHIYSKQIVLTRENLYTRNSNIPLHEIGHAVDYLMHNLKVPLSSCQYVQDSLRATPHLNEYTKLIDEGRQNLAEHFATCFSAYFSEPLGYVSNGYHSINELHPHTIKYFQENIVEALG
jgi:hypothetical protein